MINIDALSPLCDALVTEFIRIHPNIKHARAVKIMTRYSTEIINELAYCLKYKNKAENGEYQFRTSKASPACGMFNHDNIRHHLFYYCNKFAALRLVRVVMTGHQGANSRVCLEEKYKEMIMNELGQTIATTDVITFPKEYIQTTHDDANYYIPVDELSLAAFITKSNETLLTANGNYKSTIIDNIRAARELQLLIVQHNGKSYLPETYEVADSGRSYGHGKSLQRQPKQVRYAALGICHEYDFQTNSFAVMTSVAKMIARKTGVKLMTGSIEDYIKNRTRQREIIAKEVGCTVEVIKRVFTSLGFNAQVINSPYTAVRKCFYEQEQFDKLVANRLFKYIYEDLQAVNDIILNCPDNIFDDSLQNIINKSKGLTRSTEFGKIMGITKTATKAQQLAFIYQSVETLLMNCFANIVRDQTNQDPILVVHDGIYYKHPIPKNTLIDAQYQLRQDFELIRIEHTPIYPITTDECFNKLHADYDLAVQQHRELIAAQERGMHAYINSLEPSPSDYSGLKRPTIVDHPLIAAQQYQQARNAELTRYARENDENNSISDHDLKITGRRRNSDGYIVDKDCGNRD